MARPHRAITYHPPCPLALPLTHCGPLFLSSAHSQLSERKPQILRYQLIGRSFLFAVVYMRVADTLRQNVTLDASLETRTALARGAIELLLSKDHFNSSDGLFDGTVVNTV